MVVHTTTTTEAAAAAEIPKVAISSGIHLRRMPTVVYTNSAPILFEVNFQFSKINNIVEGLTYKGTNEFLKTAIPVIRDEMTFMNDRLNEIKSSFEFFPKQMEKQQHPTRRTPTRKPGMFGGKKPAPFNETIANEFFANMTKEWALSNGFADDEWSDAENLRRRRRSGIPIVGDMIGSFDHWCCGFVTEAQLQDIYADNERMNDFMDEIKKGVVEEHASMVQINEGFRNFSRQANTRFDAVATEFTKVQQAVAEEEALLGGIAIHTLQLANSQMESIQIMEILSMCHIQRLSVAAVGPQQFRTQLLELQRNALKFGYDLVLQPEQISKYYAQHITDCLVSQTDHSIRFLIKVKVPLKHVNTEMVVYKSTILPLAIKDHTCYLDYTPEYIVSDRNQSFYTMTHTDCDTPTGLCYLTMFPDAYTQGNECLQALVNGASVEAIKDQCILTCKKNPPQMRIIQLESNLYVVNYPPPRVKMNCKGVWKQVDTPKDGIGAVQFYVPCQCEVHLTDTIVLQPGFPCMEEAVKRPVVLQLVAAQWVQADIMLHSLSKTKETADLMGIAHFDNLKSIFNDSWNVNSQILNISEVSFLAGVHKPKLHKYLPPTGAFSKWLLVLWNILLTLTVAWIICRPAGLGFLPVARGFPTEEVAGLLFNWEDYWNDYYMVFVVIGLIAVFSFFMILWKIATNADVLCGPLVRRRTVRRVVGRPRFRNAGVYSPTTATASELEDLKKNRQTTTPRASAPPGYPDLPPRDEC